MSNDRILQVITRSEWGGAPRIVESLTTNIDGVTDVACGPGGRLINRLENKGISIHVQPHLQSTPHPRDVLAYREIKKLISEGEFDLVHSHSTKAGALARIAAARAGVPSVFTVHGWGYYNTDYSAMRPLMISGERFLGRRTDEIVCVSQNDYQQGRDHGILSNNLGTVIHNGIPPLDISPSRKTLYDEFGIDSEIPVIGAIGRLTPQKNPLVILKTAKILKSRGLDVATVLIGSGPLTEKCEQYIEKHDIHNVYLPGFKENALDLLPDFDVFLLPSRFEGFPLSVLECMHAGIPIVAHDVGGVSEAIVDDETGFVVPPNETNDHFVDQVQVLLEEPQRRQEMGNRAQEIAAEQFTESRMVKEYRELYESLL